MGPNSPERALYVHFWGNGWAKLSDKNDSQTRGGKGFIRISENCSLSPCDIEARYHYLAAPVMAKEPEISVKNKDAIRVDSTHVSGTLIWNLANTSASELGASIVLTVKMPVLGRGSFPGLMQWGAVKVSPA